jgi:hypothetical protein
MFRRFSVWGGCSLSRLRLGVGWRKPGAKAHSNIDVLFLRWTEVQIPLLKQGAPTERRILQTYRPPMMTGLDGFLRNALRRAATGESRSLET